MAEYTFYSQQGEDVFVFRNFLNKRTEDGVCVDVGAFDGVQGSNTKFFEDVLGYRCVLVEPLPELAIPLHIQRPRATIYSYAIHPHETSVAFMKNGPTSGMLDTMSNDHLASWFPTPEDQMEKKTRVPAAPLASILYHAGISHIDFLSIDVEGGELLVLQSIDWDAVEVFVICVELDGTNVEKDDACRAILREQGFVFQTYVGNNDMWVNVGYSKKESRYTSDIPAYSGRFDYLNQEAQDTLPALLATFQSSLDSSSASSAPSESSAS